MTTQTNVAQTGRVQGTVNIQGDNLEQAMGVNISTMTQTNTWERKRDG